MSKEAEILRKCIFCHDKHMCQKSRKLREPCISGVSVLQKVTLNYFEGVAMQKNSDLDSERLFA